MLSEPAVEHLILEVCQTLARVFVGPFEFFDGFLESEVLLVELADALLHLVFADTSALKGIADGQGLVADFLRLSHE